MDEVTDLVLRKVILIHPRKQFFHILKMSRDFDVFVHITRQFQWRMAFRTFEIETRRGTKEEIDQISTSKVHGIVQHTRSAIIANIDIGSMFNQ